ncbi:dephospho-CoA kinase [Pantoea sp. 1.19]|uniref:dephospho-CoA kinase n=1 Tax=Pantoea sp. 1.19 TaxID=1925589 RepID=UPI00094916CD|nr:dephospho-CoA kinase [Pantoea sp. 1.19]
MVYTVALTGGIGSGKSKVAEAFAALGVPIIDADVIARQVVAPGQPALDAIVDHFGGEILRADGHLDRARLRQRIFADREEKRWLNALLHPRIQAETRRQIAACRAPWCLWVVPLLVENQLQSRADRVLVVDVDIDTQRIRTQRRDGVSREQAEQIIQAQASRAARLAVADDVIDNSGSAEAIAPRVAELAQCYARLAAEQENQHDNHRSV